MSRKSMTVLLSESKQRERKLKKELKELKKELLSLIQVYYELEVEEDEEIYAKNCCKDYLRIFQQPDIADDLLKRVPSYKKREKIEASRSKMQNFADYLDKVRGRMRNIRQRIEKLLEDK